ncbi:acyl-CoA dehydratase activase-related protein [Anaerovorax odorimutans]|uniref:Acyl-CoA dehydratase activase-related protein n=1 Tax=Anaerovorax odorimutans TaxID=109327 RepID=A0ABT1RTG2_9FIRM|nr:acyl-CoA dehydratase activase-related protein [Anaerovorax odorimutans]MCQ4638468.1 acyl-CoA dehydratase activase-related protein [Anaerovorax odorimutans]
MRVGVPKAYFYYAYKPFVESFCQGLGIQVEFSGDTDQEILERGNRVCVDEACLPVKVMCGHVKKLADSCDAVALPRIMRTEFGESICPKVAGAADLAAASEMDKKLIFTEPLYLDDRKKLEKALWKQCKKLGIRRLDFKVNFLNALLSQEMAERGLDEEGYRYKVFLAGHCYNIYDPFVNMDLIEKLHRMDIGVVTEERVTRQEKDSGLAYADLMKKPYWSFFVNNFGSMRALRKKGIDGVLYLSSFSCGTDSFTVEMLKKNLNGMPFFVLKLDEQRGEAGFDTRLEAFAELLKGRSRQ